MVMIYATGPISGGNLHPAVSLALGLAGNLEWPEVAKYVLVQIVAGLAAGFSYCALFSLLSVSLGPVALSALPYAVHAELVYTFSTLLPRSGTTRRTIPTNSSPWPAVAFSAAAPLRCMVYSLGDDSGAHFNPAVTLAVVAIDRMKCSLVDGIKWYRSYLCGRVRRTAQ